ncbi:Lipid IVA 3-deoxy-D-manno-octulosonic acid transferase [Acidisarcina polymorpha]|uniref:3-deoxy-D-manno-octulosonic acid transferase n=2 Tax=Acidisarcina polymorpha TaxID=2211140 RepID=A0A2Z5G962_9BACT|nr:Lipid IVA 3-deoxy-D-manno-octulosonic acid transferase [Acidisarcina polymorpha]
MVLYSFAWLVVLGISAPWWLWKLATTDKYRDGLRERLGRVPARLLSAGDTRPVIWIHAVSVGEAIAVSGLVRELRRRAAGYRIVVSTTTKTGQSLARERFGTGDVFYYPLDFAFAVRPYLRALKPQLLVLAETEFWPRMLWECRRSHIPVAVVNARISNRSYPKYLRLRLLWRRILAQLSLVLAQSEEDVLRLQRIGAPAERVRYGGNLKYDVRAVADAPVAVALRAALPAGAELFVCGSTLEGEEQLLLQAWPVLIARHPELRMLLAPRHPERFAAVAELLEQSGISWESRSQWMTRGSQELAPGSILLLDSIGELASVYGVAKVAFVGGSLVPAGGHNPLEPAQFGVPILMGPHYENFREIVDKLRARHAISIVNPVAVSAYIMDVLENPASLTAMGARGGEVFAAQAGATDRAVSALLAVLQMTGERK